MEHVIIAIALLCQVGPQKDGTMASQQEFQRKCQKELVKCVDSSTSVFSDRALYSCVKDFK